MKRLLVLLGISLFLAISAFGDIPSPGIANRQAQKPKTIDGNLKILLDPNATEARLVIPKSQLSRLRAELEQLDEDSNATAATLNFTKTQTIVSGLFLSLGFVFGGIWFARGRKQPQQQSERKIDKKIIGGAAVLSLFCSAAATTFVFANAGPPPQLRSIHTGLFDRKAFNGWSQAWGSIKIEISDTRATNIELIVPERNKGNGRSEE